MNLIFLFRRLVFAQVLLGIAAFCMAERNPGMLLVAGALAALSWYVTEGPTGRPLPRWLINLGSVAAVSWLIVELFYQRGAVIPAMGHFTMWLQVLLLYADKSNREYGQVLVLSLMQVVGASILSVSMIYGVFLAGYSVLSLFTVLTFQLKGTSDLVLEANKSASPQPGLVTRATPVTGRGYRWHFRATAAGVGLVCGLTAVVLFVFLPRAGQSKLDKELLGLPVTKQTGFTPQVNLTGGAPQSSNREPVLNLRLMLHGKPLEGEGQSWLLRGAALDRYDARSHTWSRGLTSGSRDVAVDLSPRGAMLAELPEDTPMLVAQITLRSAGERTLFTLHPVVGVSSANLSSVLFNPMDQQLSAGGEVTGAINYEVRRPLVVPDGLAEAYRSRTPQPDGATLVRVYDTGRMTVADPSKYAQGFPVEAGLIKVGALAQRVLREAGLSRDPAAVHDPNDEAVAQALTGFLRENFRYALVNPDPAGDEGPLVEFLFNSRRGHCELFAASLAAMARSVGMRARVITGYRASEYNRVGGYYLVRQSNAHAWTEIDLGPAGWRAYDATPPEEVALEHRVERTWLTGVRELYEHLEFAWINSFIAYDRRARDRVLENLNESIQQVSRPEGSWIGSTLAWLRETFEGMEFDAFTYSLMAVIVAFIVIGIASLLHTLVVRRRRLVALQLTALPRKQRRGLVKRLGFYLQMLDLLERHGFRRASWKSPFRFAQELADTNPMKFDPVVSLTEVFYEVRFGHRQLDGDRRLRVRAHLRQLEQNLVQKGRA